MRSGNSSDVVYKEVVIIGNGPSGIALSYMLSGNLPFLVSADHPDEMLSMRLRTGLNRCLVQQDLQHLAQGLEGRSTNPVSLLLDSLLHPYADMGLELEPLVEFKKVGAEIDHVVLGKGPPGGSWHKMDPYVLTLSLGAWMGLPGLPFHPRDSGEKRAFAYNVANYYVNYVEEMRLSQHFVNNVVVTSVVPFVDEPMEVDPKPETRSCLISNAFSFLMSRGNRKLKPNRCCKRPREGLCQGLSPDRKIREVSQSRQRRERDRSVSLSCDLSNTCDSSSDSRSSRAVPFTVDQGRRKRWVVETKNVESGESTTYHCKYVVLANGASDLPNRLELFQGRRDPPWLFHDLRSLEYHLDEYIKQRGAKDVEAVVVVGAGLSAADAVIAVRGRNIPVVHVFRNKTADLNKHLPENMYPEYHKVHQMMKDGSNYPFYQPFPEYELTDLDASARTVFLTSKTGKSYEIQTSFVAVLIGSRPDLGFLPADYRLGVKKDQPVDCKTNTLNIDKLTHRVEGCDDIFAVGPLAGDNFVRFIPGGALAVVSELYRRNNDYLCRFE